MSITLQPDPYSWEDEVDTFLGTFLISLSPSTDSLESESKALVTKECITSSADFSPHSGFQSSMPEFKHVKSQLGPVPAGPGF